MLSYIQNKKESKFSLENIYLTMYNSKINQNNIFIYKEDYSSLENNTNRSLFEFENNYEDYSYNYCKKDLNLKGGERKMSFESEETKDSNSEDNKNTTIPKRKKNKRKNFVHKSEIFKDEYEEKENDKTQNNCINPLINYYFYKCDKSLIYKKILNISSEKNLVSSNENNQIQKYEPQKMYEREDIQEIKNEPSNNQSFQSNEQTSKERTQISESKDALISLENKYQNLNDEDLAKKSFSLIKTKFGCQLIQNKLKHNPKFGNEFLFPYLKPFLIELSCDFFGNYLFQSLIQELTISNINFFLDIISIKFYNICLNKHGSRVIQSLIDRVIENNQLTNKLLIIFFKSNLLGIISSRYGNHIIQKLIVKINSEIFPNINYIYNFIYNNFISICNSKYGVCILQKCISKGNKNQRKKIYELILKNINEIIKDCHGCYLIHYLLNITQEFSDNRLNEIMPIVINLEMNFIEYCKNKISGSVIEKAIEYAHKKIRRHILNYLIDNKSFFIIEMLLDQDNNYIIQKALIKEETDLKRKIFKIIADNHRKLKDEPFGNKILSKLISIYYDLDELINEKEEENN